MERVFLAINVVDWSMMLKNKKARLTIVNQALCGADETRTRDPRRDRPIF